MSTTPEPFLAELKIRPVTRNLVAALLLDLPLDPPALCDFGVDTANHYRALKAVLFEDPALDGDNVDNQTAYAIFCERVKALDAAYGNGPRLNALVRKHAPQYAQRVRFSTSWDEILGRSEDEASEER